MRSQKYKNVSLVEISEMFGKAQESIEDHINREFQLLKNTMHNLVEQNEQLTSELETVNAKVSCPYSYFRNRLCSFKSYHLFTARL